MGIRPCAEAILLAFCAGGVFLFWPFFENTWNRRFRREYRGGPPANASFDLIPAAVSTREGWHPTSCNGEGEQYVQPPNLGTHRERERHALARSLLLLGHLAAAEFPGVGQLCLGCCGTGCGCSWLSHF